MLFTAAVFVAAALLFVVQPMVGKMVLPRAGGAPQVWNTSLLFYQTVLLAGYLYAHVSVRWLGVQRQALLHVAVLALPFLVLPIVLPDTYPPDGARLSPWVLGILTVAVGAPVFVLAAASPLLQRWLASTRHEDAGDPYYLYASSNAGSLVGLLAYPLILEPFLSGSDQSRLWAFGYARFVGLTILCVFTALYSARMRPARMRPAGFTSPLRESSRDERSVTSRDRLFWVASAAVPSALLLGVTQYLTSQIAPFSLLWVLPLAVYLGTFIAAFARREVMAVSWASRVLPMVTIVMAVVLALRIARPTWAITVLHLAVLASAGMLCHRRLAERRPPTTHLTEFYLLITTGGALGGAFSALLAPYLFDFLAEYPIAVALACLFRVPFSADEGKVGVSRFLYTGRMLDVALPGALALYILTVTSSIEWLPAGVTAILLVVVPGVVCYAFSPRIVRFALGLSVLLASAESGRMYGADLLHGERTFFGIYRVSHDVSSQVNILFHGSTIHGIQSVDPARAREPLAYYHPTGPAGHVMLAMAGQPERRTIALVGAGTGALAVLAGPHQSVTLYEIDPAVVRIAKESGYFTYLSNARASIETVIGDGRLALSRSTGRFDLIVLDAFSSGAIPLHLLTREALLLYLDRLTSGGVLLFHISNPHLELAPALGAHARDLGLAAFEWVDVRGDADLERGIFGSHWVLIAGAVEDLAYIPKAGWRPLVKPPATRAWTDDFSDLLSVQAWN